MTQAMQQQKSDWLYRCQFVGVMNACLASAIVMMEVFWTEGWIEWWLSSPMLWLFFSLFLWFVSPCFKSFLK